MKLLNTALNSVSQLSNCAAISLFLKSRLIVPNSCWDLKHESILWRVLQRSQINGKQQIGKNVQSTLCYLVKDPGRLDILGVDGKVPKYTEQLMNILHHPEAAVLLKLGVLDYGLQIE